MCVRIYITKFRPFRRVVFVFLVSENETVTRENCFVVARTTYETLVYNSLTTPPGVDTVTFPSICSHNSTAASVDPAGTTNTRRYPDLRNPFTCSMMCCLLFSSALAVSTSTNRFETPKPWTTRSGRPSMPSIASLLSPSPTPWSAQMFDLVERDSAQLTKQCSGSTDYTSGESRIQLPQWKGSSAFSGVSSIDGIRHQRCPSNTGCS